jgi:AraC family ethanolamine operon transcriptional activator
VRLGGARRSLKQGAGSVTDASLQWGFDHPSAFARDYQAMFGELPSQTLERVRPVRLARDLARCPVF